MDELRILYELLNKYAQNEDYSTEFIKLVSPRLVGGIPSKISLDLVFQIVDIHHFNVAMFNIDKKEHFNTTEEVRAFLIDDNFNFDADYLDFIETYTQRGYFINFEINTEWSSNNPFVGVMTRFGYKAAD